MAYRVCGTLYFDCKGYLEYRFNSVMYCIKVDKVNHALVDLIGFGANTEDTKTTYICVLWFLFGS